MTFFNIFSKKSIKENKKKQTIIIDFREKNSLVPSELSKLNFQIEFKSLPVADYLLNNIAIERKTISDLKSSIINKRIFLQLLELKQYPKSFLIIEGNLENLFDNFVLSENALRGFLLSLSEYQIPHIFSKDEKETALYLSLLSRKKEKSFSLRPSKIALTKEEQILYILEGFPGIGPKTAKKLVEKFNSLKNIINAEEEQLKEILGKRTPQFKNLIDEII